MDTLASTKADGTAGGKALEHPGGDGRTAALKPTPSQQFGWVGFVALLFIIGWIAHFAGCDDATGGSNGAAHTLTKAEWRQKVSPFYSSSGNQRKLTTVSEFKRVMGEPSSTQTIEGHAYWYYDCADGTIQVDLVDPNMSGGTLAIDAINDY